MTICVHLTVKIYPILYYHYLIYDYHDLKIKALNIEKVKITNANSKNKLEFGTTIYQTRVNFQLFVDRVTMVYNWSVRVTIQNIYTQVKEIN